MMIFWTLTIAISIGLLVVTAAARGSGVEMAYAHMALSAVMGLVFCLMASREVRSVGGSGRNRDAAVSGVLSQYMGMVWAWGALALAVTYGTGVVSWKEWPGFFVAFAALAAVSFFISQRLLAASEQAAPDDRLLKVSRYLGMGLLAGTIITMLGLIIDGKMVRFLETQKAPWQDWAANNYFFFGAAALAILSAYGLFAVKPQKS
ncbi:MAG: hypothetical protein AAFY53_00340 [Pseudomonadota bacterium]